MTLRDVVTAKIHPAIGIARVGDSDESFIAPELPYRSRVAAAPGGKDRRGRLRRQAARFRIFGYDAAGGVVEELSASTAEIEWSVRVANTKAAWYDFRYPLDLFPADSPNWLSASMARRNAWLDGSYRERLRIRPPAAFVRGRHGGPIGLEGKFFDHRVSLGSVHTDDDGRLVFVPGCGAAGTIFEDRNPGTFANNTGWYDDICDGPVHAEVRVGGKKIPVDGAWIVTAPPSYAPDLLAAQTLYDVVYQASLSAWTRADTANPSFQRDILPIFQRLSQGQWVNAGFFARYGWRGQYDFDDNALLQAMSADPRSAGDAHAALRKEIYAWFRQPDRSGPGEPPFRWPPVFGDAAYSFDDNPRDAFTYTSSILARLQKWSVGEFVSDFDPAPAQPMAIEDVPIQSRPHTLDRAALNWCVGGPFHPGCELTWIMRRESLYRFGMRIRERPAVFDEADYGDRLTPAVALASDGPLSCSGPGDLTRWMAVPWQTDASGCDSGGDSDPHLPAYWPARVPNQVLAEEEYARVIDDSLPLDDRVAAFKTRRDFLRGLDPEAPDLVRFAKMIDAFGRLGVVEARANPHFGEPREQFPKEFFVETGFEAEVQPDVLARSLDAGGAQRVSSGRRGGGFGGRRRHDWPRID